MGAGFEASFSACGIVFPGLTELRPCSAVVYSSQEREEVR